MKQLAAMGMEERLAQIVCQIDAILAEDRAATDVIVAVRWTERRPNQREGAGYIGLFVPPGN